MKKLISLFLFLFITNFSVAQQETLVLDTSFGDGGAYYGADFMSDFLFLSENQMYLGKYFHQNNPFKLSRLTNGIRDYTFNNPSYYFEYEQISDFDNLIGGMTQQPNGKFLIASEFSLFRVNQDGTMDENFGNQGEVPSAENTKNVDVYYNDGKIYRVFINFSDSEQAYIERLNENGEIDTSFGNNGQFDTNIYHPNWGPDVKMKFLPDGEIIFAYRYTIFKMNNSGSNYISRTFSSIINIELQNDKIILERTGEGLIRLNHDLSTDTTFGNNGNAHLPIDQVFNYTVYNDKIYVFASQPSSYDYVILRLTEDGFLDYSFSGNSVFTLDIDIYLRYLKIENDNIFIYGGSFYEGLILKYTITEQLITTEHNSFQIKIYPNPTTDKLYFENLKTASSVKILNAESKFIMKKTIQPNGFIDISALPKGVYVAVLNGNSYKLIKK